MARFISVMVAGLILSAILAATTWIQPGGLYIS